MGRGALAKRWMLREREVSGRCERRWVDKEQAGCQRFQRLDRHRDDLFAAAPPLEAVRATKSSNGPAQNS